MRVITLDKVATEPVAPAAGRVVFYTKTDDQVYFKGADGVEYLLIQTPANFAIGVPLRYGTAYNGLANTIAAFPVELFQAGTLASMSIWCGTSGGKVKLGVYANDGPGKTTADTVIPGPGTLLAECAEFDGAEQSWNAAVLTSPPVLQPGTYWLAALFQSSLFTTRRSSVGFGWTQLTASQTYGASLPGTFPSGVTLTDSKISMFGTMQIV